MRITQVRELAVRLEGNVANAVVNFAEHTVSLVAVVTDVDAATAGRWSASASTRSAAIAQSGILRDRMIPRLLAADAGRRCSTSGGDALRPGQGPGDRSCATRSRAATATAPARSAALELAIWDLNAKLADEPAYATIARAFGRRRPRAGRRSTPAGGYYYPRRRRADAARRVRSATATWASRASR